MVVEAVYTFENTWMMAESDNLAEIIEDCKKGRQTGFSRLVDMYSGRLYGYFYRLSGNREVSDDLLSEVFLRLVERIDSYRGGRFDSWLFKIASNIFYDYLRSKQKERKVLESREEQIERDSVASEVVNGDIDDLQQQLDKLDEDTRELIMLRFYSQLSFKEISQIRAEPIGTTLSKVHRGLKKLRELMEH
jgi:RNA polymerase sigma-70 factor (ECF subfamily)